MTDWRQLFSSKWRVKTNSLNFPKQWRFPTRRNALPLYGSIWYCCNVNPSVFPVPGIYAVAALMAHKRILSFWAISTPLHAREFFPLIMNKSGCGLGQKHSFWRQNVPCAGWLSPGGRRLRDWSSHWPQVYPRKGCALKFTNLDVKATPWGDDPHTQIFAWSISLAMIITMP